MWKFSTECEKPTFCEKRGLIFRGSLLRESPFASDMGFFLCARYLLLSVLLEIRSCNGDLSRGMSYGYFLLLMTFLLS
jgi:hypothetical protein